jgi:hypothetical protein
MMMRREETKAIRVVKKINVEGKRGRSKRDGWIRLRII